MKSLSDAARARLDRVLPALLHAATRSPQPDAALKRVLGLLQAVLRRTSYLALLDEQPSALARLVDVLARSALLAERLAAYPLLLDELLDVRVSGPMPDAAGMLAECQQVLVVEDPEPRCAGSTKRGWRSASAWRWLRWMAARARWTAPGNWPNWRRRW